MKQLENESIEIIREAVAGAGKPEVLGDVVKMSTKSAPSSKHACLTLL